MIRALLLAAALPLAVAAASAQHQPYAALADRSIKALSEQQVEDLRQGRGMGLALAAELNGYPGPLHVLELGDQLDLTAGQRAQVEGLFAAMKADAVPLGERILAHERELDRQFAEKTVTPASLARTTEAIGAVQGKLRAAHLRYHLETVAILSPEQVRRYAELRGYAEGSQGHGGERPAHGGHH